jgi:hypothetical protein
VSRARWLVLFHQLPPKPDYLRVKIRRRLQDIGALPLKNSVYVLPNQPEALEDFQWVRQEIIRAGGEATLCASEFVEGVNDAEIIKTFARASDGEYREVLKTARSLGRVPAEHDVARLRRSFNEALSRDHVGAPSRARAEHTLSTLEARVSRRRARDTRRPPGAQPGQSEVSMPRPAGATWVTRQNIFVDRMASAWLIGRFIDERARFKFVTDERYHPAPDELRFDMFEGEFTHEGEHCTFETLLARFMLDDPALSTIGEIVHDIDCKDDKFGRDETAGIRHVLQGIRASLPTDDARLDAARVVFDGLYATFRRGK